MRVQVHARTDLGRKRNKNEDRFRVDRQAGLFLVADGMGGHMAGEIASRLAVDTIVDFIRVASQDDSTWPFEIDTALPDAVNRLKVAIQLANRRIFETALDRPELEGMGTTVVAACLDGELAHVAHVGDSRAYLIRSHRIVPLTSDHSWVNIQLALGAISEDEARHHPMKNIITRALGTRREVEVDIRSVTIRPGDHLLLCSDGLSGSLADHQILELVEQSAGQPEMATAALIERANEQGGDDNITVVVMALEQASGADDEVTEVIDASAIEGPAPGRPRTFRGGMDVK